MSAIARAALLTILMSLHAGAQIRSLAIYAGPGHNLDDAAIRFTQQEVQRLLVSAEIEVFWKDLENRKPDEQFDQVIVLSFSASCAEPVLLSAPKNLPDSVDSLADSSVSKGRVLPFVNVHCSRIAQMLAPALLTMKASEKDAAFGRSLGRVIAHEIYHVVGDTTEHQSRGVAKASFSVTDLTTEEFGFDYSSLAQMRATALSAAASGSPQFLAR